ncbi:MAG: hypothetical protein MI700_10410, partial [Balneolales bacterium]|nr:hypothetical protein [Balneolales bacterium]
MAQKESRKSSHLNNDLDPSFDLDDYLNEQASKTASAVEEEPDDPAYRTKNVILFALVIATATLWYFDWSPRQMYAFFFGNNADATVTEVIPPIDINIPPIEVNIPDITIPTPPSPPVAQAPPAPPSIAMGTVIDYLNQLNERGLLTDNLLSAFEA